MAKLTKVQKNYIEMVAIYYAMAGKELEANGVTAEYDSHVWMYVLHRERLGLDVAPHERVAADRHLEKLQKVAA
jgi:hypothetical protein